MSDKKTPPKEANKQTTFRDSVKGGYNGPKNQDTRPAPPPKPPAKG